jgi:hypothetical protein
MHSDQANLSSLTEPTSIEVLHTYPSLTCLKQRRLKVQAALQAGEVALIGAGHPAPRNFPARDSRLFHSAYQSF